ncbi:MAG: hypothetical protein EPO08_21355 [Rhodospirillaceae bacterium]|nr:MAG: hypothetical protein EPO08_21355 [Rhodospirillaceae bacterium]
MIETRWAQDVSDGITSRVRQIRLAKGIPQGLFAQQCTASGLPMSKSAMTMAESGDRISVTVQELLVFAHVLQVSPVELLLPQEGVVEVLPGIEAEAAQARQWVTGALRFEEA